MQQEMKITDSSTCLRSTHPCFCILYTVFADPRGTAASLRQASTGTCLSSVVCNNVWILNSTTARLAPEPCPQHQHQHQHQHHRGAGHLEIFWCVSLHRVCTERHLHVKGRVQRWRRHSDLSKDKIDEHEEASRELRSV